MSLKILKDTLISRFLPFLRWLPELKNKATLRSDLIAGLTVALVLVPQSMAYAQLAGLSAHYGLYAALLPPMLAALFGSSRQLSTGPVAVVSLLTASALGPLASSSPENYAAYAILLALLVGLFQLTLGLLRLGVLLNFLSHPVVVGFTNAAAIIIATSQLGKIFGVEVEKSSNDEYHYTYVWNTIVATVKYIHWPTLFVAIVAFTIMILTKRHNPKLPYVLFAVAITTFASWLFNYHDETTVTLEQIHSSTIRDNVNHYLQNIESIKKITKDSHSAIATYKKRVAVYGEKDILSLEAKNTVTLRETDLEKLSNDQKSLLKIIKSPKFGYFIDSTTKAAVFALHSEEPKQTPFQSKNWHVKSISAKESGISISLETGGKIIQHIEKGLPSFKVPSIDWTSILKLFSMAVVISLIGFMEAISIAKAMAARTRQRLDANQELIGQGLSNIIGSFFQSYAVSGSFSRSAVNLSSGAITGFSSVVTSIVVGLTLLFFTPVLYHLPAATLAAVIMIAVVGLLNFTAIKHAWHANRTDGIVSLVTFALTLLYAPHLEKGILIGVTLSLVLFLWRTMEPRLVFVSMHEDGTHRCAKVYNLKTCNEIAMLRFDGSLYFANVTYLEEKIQKLIAQSSTLKFLILDGVAINHVDASGEDMLREIAKRLGELKIQVLFARFKKPIMDMLEHTNLISEHGREFFFRKTESALDYAWSHLEPGHKEHCPLQHYQVKASVPAPTTATP